MFFKDDAIKISEVFIIYLVEDKLNNLLINSDINIEIKRGWGNGYVSLPKWHPYHGIDYNKIPIFIHGGLTFSGMDEENGEWVIGFDTNHFYDTLIDSSFDYVKEETYRLLEQCIEAPDVKIKLKLLKIKRIYEKNLR